MLLKRCQPTPRATHVNKAKDSYDSGDDLDRVGTAAPRFLCQMIDEHLLDPPALHRCLDGDVIDAGRHAPTGGTVVIRSRVRRNRQAGAADRSPVEDPDDETTRGDEIEWRLRQQPGQCSGVVGDGIAKLDHVGVGEAHELASPVASSPTSDAPSAVTGSPWPNRIVS